MIEQLEGKDSMCLSHAAHQSGGCEEMRNGCRRVRDKGAGCCSGSLNLHNSPFFASFFSRKRPFNKISAGDAADVGPHLQLASPRTSVDDAASEPSKCRVGLFRACMHVFLGAWARRVLFLGEMS